MRQKLMGKKVRIFGKQIPVFVLVLIAVVGLVSAGVLTYYALVTINVHVTQPIQITGEQTQSVECVSGGVCYGTDITVSNTGTTEKTIKLSSTIYDNIKTTLVGELELTKKTVDFGNPVWEIPEDADKVKVQYTLVGDKFSAKVVEGELPGYELIYYKDNSDRFNSPARAIRLSEITGNLPYTDDANVDEYNYCTTGEYKTCHGAKLWYVPSDAINSDGSLDWSRADEFFYETFLIQFNPDGNIIVYPDSSVTFKPQFEVNTFLPTGDYPVSITIA